MNSSTIFRHPGRTKAMRKLVMPVFGIALMLLPLRLWGKTPDEKVLRILTINVWSGLDYEGVFRFGEYESPQRRERRFETLVTQVTKLDPDVVFVQEANFAGRYAHRLADALGFDEIHQVVNGGIKLGPIGIPVNFKEGMAILARPSLKLRSHDVWKLSGPFGLFGDALTIHFQEAVFSLVGKITANGMPLYLVNVHLVASPPEEESLIREFQGLVETRPDSGEQVRNALAEIKARNLRRAGEIQHLIKRLKTLPEEVPVVLAGDFNTAEDAPEIQTFVHKTGAIDVLNAVRESEPDPCREPVFTWDPQQNENIGFSLRTVNASSRPRSGYGLLNALEGTIRRRIDCIFLYRHFRPDDVLSASQAVDSSETGLHASDHFGVCADVDLGRVQGMCPKESTTIGRLSRSFKEFLPILMYDTDIGIGYGVKGFLLNPLHGSESFDLILFNSSRGERWYKLVLSWPDFEMRQRKVYPLAVDITLNYDKMIKNRFFGVGSGSSFKDLEYYTKEPFEASLALGRGFTTRAIGQAGLRYKTVRNSNFSSESRLEELPPSLNASRATYFSLFTNLRYDSRNSFIHPSEGLVLQGEAEYAPRTSWTNVRFSRFAGWFQYYTVLFYPKTILACCLGAQSLFGRDLPVQVLLPLGGNRTLRGSPQDRYLDKSHIIMNAELRFPLFWRFGGVCGMDAGKVWPSLSKADLHGWVANPTVGLRFYMNTFIVRLDIGLGKESTGLYFNFGHIF